MIHIYIISVYLYKHIYIYIYIYIYLYIYVYIYVYMYIWIHTYTQTGYTYVYVLSIYLYYDCIYITKSSKKLKQILKHNTNLCSKFLQYKYGCNTYIYIYIYIYQQFYISTKYIYNICVVYISLNMPLAIYHIYI